jgi:ATP-dependent helicase HrpB
MPPLPIHTILPQLLTALCHQRIVVLAAPPGSGKTTGVPLALLNEEWLRGSSILILEPRRLAARMAAQRMAQVLGEGVGQQVGYRVRFDNQVSATTRIEVVTEGILTRRLQHDPELAGVGLIVFDEFHERSIHADLALSLSLDVMAGLRDDLRILIMSATLDLPGLAAFLDDPAVVVGQGQSYPVTVHYRPRPAPLGRGQTLASGYNLFNLIDAMTATTAQALMDEEGDILAFLPGAEEIRRLAARLATLPQAKGVEILPLFGDLPKAVQDRAVTFVPGGKRRVIIATSIAETSLTIEGVRVVIDGGYSRCLRFDPNSGLGRLVTCRVSQAAAEQRRGRAGRLSPGVCYRLWAENEQQHLPSHGRPEILDADLAPLALDLAAWGVASPLALRWLDPPPPGPYAAAIDLLTLLGGLDLQGRITAVGKRMAALPVHPRLARMLIAAEEGGNVPLACDIAALLTERDIIRRGDGGRTTDLDRRLQLLAAFRQGGSSDETVDRDACARVEAVAKQLRRLLTSRPNRQQAASVGALLARAYPDRIGQQRPGTHDRYRLAQGRGVRLAETDPLTGSPYLVAAHLDAGQVEGRVYLAAAITVDEIRASLPDLITTPATTFWDGREEAVISRCQERILDLVVSERPWPQAAPEAVLNALLTGIKGMGSSCLPWSKEARSFQARVTSLHHWLPDQGWPDLSDEALVADPDWLAPYCQGMSRRQHLCRLDILAILRAMLDWPHTNSLADQAPTHFQCPSGSRLPLHYTPGQAPVLAVRLQELFGLAETPTVAGGRVPVLLHLLSPGQRPIQITRDLRGFWDTTYPEVKKELKGRYPKHVWPDDPWTARPTARAQPRRKT